jgi:hypothetical protein
LKPSETTQQEWLFGENVNFPKNFATLRGESESKMALEIERFSYK